MQDSATIPHGTPIDGIVAALQSDGLFNDAVRTGTNEITYSIKCPFPENHKHGDRKPSAYLFLGNMGTAMVGCQGCNLGGKFSEAWQRLGVDPRDPRLRSNGITPNSAPASQYQAKIGEEVARYDYPNEYGDLVYSVLRFEPDGEPKTFRPLNHATGKLEDVPDDQKVLYQLPKVMEATAVGAAVYVCEGEKDADRLQGVLDLRGLGEAATTWQGGAGRWLWQYTRWLVMANVTFVPDLDTKGIGAANKVGKDLASLGTPMMVAYPQSITEALPNGGGIDLSDVFDEADDEVGAFDQIVAWAFPFDIEALVPLSDQWHIVITDTSNDFTHNYLFSDLPYGASHTLAVAAAGVGAESNNGRITIQVDGMSPQVFRNQGLVNADGLARKVVKLFGLPWLTELELGRVLKFVETQSLGVVEAGEGSTRLSDIEFDTDSAGMIVADYIDHHLTMTFGKNSSGKTTTAIAVGIDQTTGSDRLGMGNRGAIKAMLYVDGEEPNTKAGEQQFGNVHAAICRGMGYDPTKSHVYRMPFRTTFANGFQAILAERERITTLVDCEPHEVLTVLDSSRMLVGGHMTEADQMLFQRAANAYGSPIFVIDHEKAGGDDKPIGLNQKLDAVRHANRQQRDGTRITLTTPATNRTGAEKDDVFKQFDVEWAPMEGMHDVPYSITFTDVTGSAVVPAKSTVAPARLTNTDKALLASGSGSFTGKDITEAWERLAGETIKADSVAAQLRREAAKDYPLVEKIDNNTFKLTRKGKDRRRELRSENPQYDMTTSREQE